MSFLNKLQDFLLIRKFVRRMEGSKSKIVSCQIFKKAANLGPSRGVIDVQGLRRRCVTNQTTSLVNHGQRFVREGEAILYIKTKGWKSKYLSFWKWSKYQQSRVAREQLEISFIKAATQLKLVSSGESEDFFYF